MMHLMKNVACKIVQLLTGYKDSFKVRKAEQELGRFSSSLVQESQVSQLPLMVSILQALSYFMTIYT